MPPDVANTNARKPRVIGRPFQKGNVANPAGRPKGSRNKLAEDFLKALSDDFAEHGIGAIQEARKDRPAQYLQIVASLMPKDVNINVKSHEEWLDELSA